MQRPFNFSSGPAILPQPVFERAAQAIRGLRRDGHAPDGEPVGLSILEVSHRGAPYTEVHEAAVALAHKVLQIPPDTHKLLLLPGGASQQFAMVPLNLGLAGTPAYFIDTGVWSVKAHKEASQVTDARVLASSADTDYDRIPAFDVEQASDGAYLHLTTNNTIYGTEYPEIPDVGEVPLVADMSSHVGSRPLDWSRIALGYAGAQKNLGASGVTLVAIRHELLERGPVTAMPNFFRYTTHAAKNSTFNTPNTFGVLVLKLVLEWLRDQGGVEAMGTRNVAKAARLYDALDSSSLFEAKAKTGHRSNMNVTFTLAGVAPAEREAMTARFVAESEAAGLSGLKGHRSVGGCRASIYNAFPEAGVDALIAFLKDFERRQ